MKVGDVVQLDPEYNQGKWCNAMALIVGLVRENLEGPEFFAVVCNGEVFDAPAWSLTGIEV